MAPAKTALAVVVPAIVVALITVIFPFVISILLIKRLLSAPQDTALASA